MSEDIYTLRLRDFLTAGEGWGHKAGEAARKKLLQRLDLNSTAKIVRISMAGGPRLDVACATQALIQLVRSKLGSQAICLVDLTDDDVRANIAAAAACSGVPITLWNGVAVHVVGPKLTGAMQDALTFALARPEIRTAEFAAATGLTITIASNRFKALWEDGYLLRDQATAASGGTEFVYARIG